MAFLAVASMQSDVRQSPSIEAARWTIDYGRASCTLARRTGDGDAAILALNAPLGTEPGEFVLLDGGAGLDSRLAGDLEIGFGSGAPIAVRGRSERRNGRALVKLAPMPDDFLLRLAGAGRLAVTRNGEELVSIALPDAQAGVDALARCNDDLLQSWGIDVEARRTLSRLPRLRGAEWALEIMPRADTNLVFVADVTAGGGATTCRVTVSSQNPRMDRDVCDLVRNRARFEPALDRQGHAIASQYVTRIRWMAGGRHD